MAVAKPAGKGATEDISLDAAASHLLEECRMVLPGIQALFGFQLIAVFNQGFGEKLSHGAQMVHVPAALHRLSEPRSVSDRVAVVSASAPRAP